MINQHNNHATQMNTHQVNHRLVFSLIGLSFFTISMLIVNVFLIFFVPALSHCYAAWKAKSRVKRRSRIMKKLNLVELPIHSAVEIQSPLSLHTVSATIPTTVSPLPSSLSTTGYSYSEDQKSLNFFIFTHKQIARIF